MSSIFNYFIFLTTSLILQKQFQNLGQKSNYLHYH